MSIGDALFYSLLLYIAGMFLCALFVYTVGSRYDGLPDDNDVYGNHMVFTAHILWPVLLALFIIHLASRRKRAVRHE